MAGAAGAVRTAGPAGDPPRSRPRGTRAAGRRGGAGAGGATASGARVHGAVWDVAARPGIPGWADCAAASRSCLRRFRSPRVSRAASACSTSSSTLWSSLSVAGGDRALGGTPARGDRPASRPRLRRARHRNPADARGRPVGGAPRRPRDRTGQHAVRAELPAAAVVVAIVSAPRNRRYPAAAPSSRRRDFALPAGGARPARARCVPPCSASADAKSLTLPA